MSSTTYAEKLRDPRWLNRRTEVIAKAEGHCEECGITNDESRAEQRSGLEVHHVTYILGRQPWEYPDDLLICLCPECHFNRQIFDEETIVEIARMLRRMGMWEVYGLGKKIRWELDGGWAPGLHDAFARLKEQCGRLEGRAP